MELIHVYRTKWPMTKWVHCDVHAQCCKWFQLLHNRVFTKPGESKKLWGKRVWTTTILVNLLFHNIHLSCAGCWQKYPKCQEALIPSSTTVERKEKKVAKWKSTTFEINMNHFQYHHFRLQNPSHDSIGGSLQQWFRKSMQEYNIT